MQRALYTSRWRGVGMGLFVVGAALVGVVVRDAYYLSILTFIAIHSIIAVGLCLLIGYAGQISLGHAAFYALGAYTSAILTTKSGWSPWLALPVAILVSCVVAYVLGVPALRLKGHYLAMATLGFGMIVNIVLKEFTAVTGGNSGLTDIPALSIGGLALSTDRRFYFLAWLAASAVLLFSANVADSRAGRALRAVHGSEQAAAISGVDIARYKIKVFVLSAGYAAVAGFLYAHYVKFISPQPFDFKFSIELLVMVMLGGAASVWGGLFGAAVVTVLGEVLRNLGDYDIVAFGVILTVVMIVLPVGVLGWIGRIGQARRVRRLALARAAPAPVE